MWLVLGYGSSLHSDDAIGVIAAQEVCARTDDRLVQVRTAVQLTLELAQPVSTADGVIFIDASVHLPPGELVVECLAPDQAEAARAAGNPHHCSPATLLHCAELLYGNAPSAWIYLIGGAEFGLGETLSPAVARALLHVVDRVVEHLKVGFHTH